MRRLIFELVVMELGELTSSYLPNDTEEIRLALLNEIGISSVEEVFSDIPRKVRLEKILPYSASRSELEVRRVVERILSKNITTKDLLSFIGGGVWGHYVPSAIDVIASRGEFQTGYTPYQPEISQGMLQSLFEYQSMMAELLELDIVNSSMYDWASSLGEAARMATRITHRTEFLVPHFISPQRLATLKSYTMPVGIKVNEIQQSSLDGQIDHSDLEEKISSKTAALYVENPSYLGSLLLDLKGLAEAAHDEGSLFIVGVDPSSLGVITPPGKYGADIVVGEGQPLGNYINFGGPLLGIFACRNESRFVRQVPGRLVGMTTSKEGDEKRYCMVLQTREQHIRRDNATSNICTNNALCALRAAIYMALMSGNGLRRLGHYILAITQYAAKRLSTVKGVKAPIINAPHFKDFTINFDGSGLKGEEIANQLFKKRIVAGRTLTEDFHELGETYLYSVTEMHTRDDVDLLYESLRSILES